jgi:hypothetical protein
MNKNHVDPEIDAIERYAIGKWIHNEDALLCGRCGGFYVPSGSSDLELCGSCVPLRLLECGDRSPRYPTCLNCGKTIRGRRGDAKYCSDSCKTLACRKRGNSSRETAQNSENAEDLREDMGSGVIRKHSPSEEASA